MNERERLRARRKREAEHGRRKPYSAVYAVERPDNVRMRKRGSFATTREVRGSGQSSETVKNVRLIHGVTLSLYRAWRDCRCLICILYTHAGKQSRGSKYRG